MLAKLKESKTGVMLKRSAVRSLVLGIFCLICWWALEALIGLAREYNNDLAARFPELLVIFRSIAILVWFELSVFWIRLALQPGVDIQEPAKNAAHEPLAAALVFGIHQTTWMFRILILMKLSDFL